MSFINNKKLIFQLIMQKNNIKLTICLMIVSIDRHDLNSTNIETKLINIIL